MHTDGKHTLHGVSTCGSVWECPVCAAVLYARRASEVTQAVRLWESMNEHHRSYLLTLTLRHHQNQNLKPLRQGLANAWRRMNAGGNALRRAWGIRHTIRAVEVTHGDNGWHPHLHVLLMSDAPLPEYFETDMLNKWQTAVSLELGLDAVPNAEHAVQLDQRSDATYIAKLGLEVSGIHSKESKNGNRTPWKIARDATDGDAVSSELWAHYCNSMKGARQLTWSKGTRKMFKLGEDDNDIQSDKGIDATEGVEGCVVEWAPKDWDANVKTYPVWLDMVMTAASSETPLLSLLKLPGAKVGTKGVVTTGRKKLKPVAQRRSSSDGDAKYHPSDESVAKAKAKAKQEARETMQFIRSLASTTGHSG